VQRRGGNVNRILSDAHTNGDVDVHQLNCTYFSALDCDEDRYVAARAIQLFARGVPQIYYVGLLAGENDGQAVLASGEGRAINRHNYTVTEVEAAVRRPVVQRVLDLIRLRNTEPAFAGHMEASTRDDSTLLMSWLHEETSCDLEVDLLTGRASITSRRDGHERRITP
jgi:hypothetical protein